MQFCGGPNSNGTHLTKLRRCGGSVPAILVSRRGGGRVDVLVLAVLQVGETAIGKVVVAVGTVVGSGNRWMHAWGNGRKIMGLFLDGFFIWSHENSPRPESKSDGRVTKSSAAGDDALAGGPVRDKLDVRLVPVDVMDPLVGRLPNDGANPQRQVGGHHVHEAESRH